MFLRSGAFLFILIVSVLSEVSGQTQEDLLPFPKELRAKVQFWTAIYTKYSTNQGLIHDSEDLSVIYEAVELPRNGDLGGVDIIRAQLRETIFNILRKRGENLTVQERKLLSKFPSGAGRARLLKATENIRFQRGQADRFKEGIRRSGYYLKHIEQILKEEGVPNFVKFLPHVESSFQENAISKFGAAGLWQLMPGSAKSWIRVGYEIDERLDPWLATKAAARHLKRDYKSLGAWPLALTAYNHGPGGVRRAVQSLGTTDIAEIAFNYSSPSFGFASRNFYVQFLAATEVAGNYRKYFGDLQLPEPLKFESFYLKQPTYVRALESQYVFTPEEFRRLNPGLRPPVMSGARPIPMGTLVRVPPNSKRTQTLVASLDKKAASAAVPKAKSELELRAALPKPKPQLAAAPFEESRFKLKDVAEGRGWIEVGMNETIAQLSEWLNVPLEDLRGWNGMDPLGQIRQGQRLLVKVAKVDIPEFEKQRADYHRQIREDFFARYEVTKLENYDVKRGENLWSLCYQKFEIPPWLLAEYNSTINLENLAPGQKLKIPTLREKNSEEIASSLN